MSILTRKDSFPLRQSMGIDFGPSLSGQQPVQAMAVSRNMLPKKAMVGVQGINKIDVE